MSKNGAVVTFDKLLQAFDLFLQLLRVLYQARNLDLQFLHIRNRCGDDVGFGRRAKWNSVPDVGGGTSGRRVDGFLLLDDARPKSFERKLVLFSANL